MKKNTIETLFSNDPIKKELILKTHNELLKSVNNIVKYIDGNKEVLCKYITSQEVENIKLYSLSLPSNIFFFKENTILYKNDTIVYSIKYNTKKYDFRKEILYINYNYNKNILSIGFSINIKSYGDDSNISKLKTIIKMNLNKAIRENDTKIVFF